MFAAQDQHRDSRLSQAISASSIQDHRMICCDSNCQRQFDDLYKLFKHYLHDHEAGLVPGQIDSNKFQMCQKHGVRKDIKEPIKCGGCASTVSFAFEQFDSSCEKCWSYMKSEYVNGNHGHR